ncbi:MAG: metallophosphoesterase [Gemmatimonadota bacterium]|jgi:hypothetical protein
MRLAVLTSLALLAACTPSQVRYQTVLPDEPGGPLDAVLYLVGDAGEANPARADVLADLTRDIDAVTGEGSPPVVVAFLGDNVYDAGLPTEPSEEDLDKLTGQVQALGDHPDVRGVFLPGNHDWANGASFSDGRAAIERQIEWVQGASAGQDVTFLPDDGCPGPASVDLGRTTRLIFIDTEWLLREPERRCGTTDEFYGRLTEQLRAAGGRRVVVLAHHPLVSGGPHGGNVAPLENGPFVYYLARKSGVPIQDLSSGRYSEVIGHLREAIDVSGVRPLAFVAGHDHTLQVLGMTGSDAPWYQLVSGAGSKSERSRWIPGMRFATDGYGYMRLDFRSGGAQLTVFARDVESGPVHPVFGCSLSPVDDGCPEAPRAAAGS